MADKKPAPPLPDTSQDFCCLCSSRAAPYVYRDREEGIVQRFCRLHVPAHFGIPPSLVRMIEEAMIAQGFENAKGSP